MQSKSTMRGSLYSQISIVLCWLLLLACPLLGEPQPAFFDVKLDHSMIRLEVELPYSGPEDQISLKAAAQREVGEAFTIGTKGGAPLSGQLKEVKFGQASLRDELSGEALKDDPQRKCLIAIWEYPYSGDPDRVVLRSKIKEPVSFVTHHLGVRLHDQAPLKAQQELGLDWGDPWYSGFLNSDLSRTPSESIACFLYLEPGQTRLEVVARPRDLQSMGQLELGAEPELSPERQLKVGEQVGEILNKRLGLQMNGGPLELRFEKAQFVRRTPTSADALEPGQPIPVHSATIGTLFLGPAVSEAGELKLRCQLFGPRVREIPATIIEGDQVRKVSLLPDVDGLIKIEAPPEGRSLSPVKAPPGTTLGYLLLLAGGLLVLGAVLMLVGGTGSKAFLVGSVLWLLAGLGGLKMGLSPNENLPKADLQSLLGNIYQAFEAPTEEAIYDRLAVSVEGELLSQVYLQTRKGLEAEQGVQVNVERVEVSEATVTSADWWGEGVRVRAFWEVSGSVGHWGHEHQRTNWYKAELKLKSIGGDWKLTELEVLDEVRM